jgi:hypothetical protein
LRVALDASLSALTRLRALGADLGPRYVLANIPAARIEAIENGVAVSRHTAVVGKPDKERKAGRRRNVDRTDIVIGSLNGCCRDLRQSKRDERRGSVRDVLPIDARHGFTPCYDALKFPLSRGDRRCPQSGTSGNRRSRATHRAEASAFCAVQMDTLRNLMKKMMRAMRGHPKHRDDADDDYA